LSQSSTASKIPRLAGARPTAIVMEIDLRNYVY
jgi:hypothetical protein